ASAPVERLDTRAARRALGAQLAALREAAGLTQHALAPLVGYGRSTVGNVEVGLQRVPRSFWVRCDEVFATAGQLTEGWATCPRAALTEPFASGKSAAERSGSTTATPTSTSVSRRASRPGSTPARPTAGSLTNSPPTRPPPPATARSNFTCTRTTATSSFVASPHPEGKHRNDRQSGR